MQQKVKCTNKSPLYLFYLYFLILIDIESTFYRTSNYPIQLSLNPVFRMFEKCPSVGLLLSAYDTSPEVIEQSISNFIYGNE